MSMAWHVSKTGRQTTLLKDLKEHRGILGLRQGWEKKEGKEKKTREKRGKNDTPFLICYTSVILAGRAMFFWPPYSF